MEAQKLEEQEDMVNHPKHYNKAGIETIDALQAMLTDGFDYYLQGNIIKYITRHRRKGEGRKDIEKVIHYAEMILEMEYNDK